MDREGLTPRAPSGAMGRVAFGFLAVAAVSGFALAPFWSAARPFDSLERLAGGVPWGFFLRALHAFSGFALLVVLVWHVCEVIAKRTERQLSPALWWLSVALVPLTFLALLGGFTMRGDAEGNAALAIWRRLTESVPLLGGRAAAFLFEGDAVALHHAGLLTLLLVVATAAHAARSVPDLRSWVLAGLVSAALAGALPLGLGRAPSAAPAHLLGPWYLLGLQGALEVLPVFVAWLAPSVFVAALGAVRHAGGKTRAALLGVLVAFLAADLAFTARLLSR